ncbi:MAG: hypothetical protein KAR45_11815 [Desulfobacteraceae bacterium]|nr:hypothetical protein [Desulfobacteraceae bacterium]
MGKYLEVLVDNSNLLTIEDVSSIDFKNKFKPNARDSLIIGPPSKKIVWIRFKLKNKFKCYISSRASESGIGKIKIQS